MKIRETIFSWLTHRYEVLIRDEENFEEKRTISYTHAKMLAIVVPPVAMIFIMGIMIGIFSGSKGSFQGNIEGEHRRKIIAMQQVIDSLMDHSQMQQKYAEDLKVVLTGNIKDLRMDTARHMQQKTVQTDTIDTDYLSAADIELRKEYEQINQLEGDQQENVLLQDFLFFPPIKGMISEKYNAHSGHFGTDIIAKPNEPIKAVADGTVILSSWTEDTGNVITIQHKSNIISVYKHNSALLKKTGETVKAGEVIAIIGNTGRLSSGPHLHFELWYNGNAMNAERFISF